MGSNEPSRPMDLSMNAAPLGAPQGGLPVGISPRTMLSGGQTNGIGHVAHGGQGQNHKQTSKESRGTGITAEHVNRRDRNKTIDTVTKSLVINEGDNPHPLPPTPHLFNRMGRRVRLHM